MKIRITYLSDYLKKRNIKKGDILTVYCTGIGKGGIRYFYINELKLVVYDDECEPINAPIAEFLMSMNHYLN